MSASSLRVLNLASFSALTAKANESPRKRQHENFHASYDEPFQRLMIALSPDTYIRPHRHLLDPKPELFVCLHGRLAMFLFDDEGHVTNHCVFGPGEDTRGAELAAGQWHTVVCLEDGSILLEAKPGPFNPLSAKDFAPWAPAEDDERVQLYLASLTRLVRADSPEID